MGLLEEMLIKAKGAANTVGEKASKIVDVSKLHFELAELEASLKGKFENIGKIVYSETQNGTFSENSIANELKQIDATLYKIENLKKDIALLKNKIICKTCGAENSSNALYCSRCGHTLEIKCTYKPTDSKPEYEYSENQTNSSDNACQCESESEPIHANSSDNDI